MAARTSHFKYRVYAGTLSAAAFAGATACAIYQSLRG
jgi:hypothetical protein